MTVLTAGTIVMVAMALQAAAPGGGDPDAGRAVFEGRGRSLTCHRVSGSGTGSARDLSWIGILRTPEKLHDAVTNPAVHPSASTLGSVDVAHLVAYLRSLRKMWAFEPGPSERIAAPATENAPFFDRPERDKEDRPDVLIDALQIPRGAAVADIGSGTGYFTWRLAEEVGPSGKVYAVDIQQEMLDRTKATVSERRFTNVEYLLATDRDPRLAPGSIDLAFLAYAYHEFADPEAMMRAIRRSLKPGGRVVVLEYAKESNIAPASPAHKMSFEELRREIEPVGFAIDQLLDFLPMQHGVVFTIK